MRPSGNREYLELDSPINFYGFFGGGSDAFIMLFGRDAFRACIFTPLPSATALMMSVKLALIGLCIFCGLLILV
jgi:hypothetical protein